MVIGPDDKKYSEVELREMADDALTMGVELDEVSEEFQTYYASYLKEKGQMQ
jgi:hypothetical protein